MKINEAAAQLKKQGSNRITLNMLVSQEEPYRPLIENSPNIIFVHQEGQIVFANPKATKELGSEKDSLLGKGIKDLVSPEFQESIKQNVTACLNGPNEKPAECKLIALSGKEIYLECTGTKIIYSGKPAVMVVGQDITEKKKLQEQLIESEQKYKSLFEQNANCVYSFDLNGYYTSCNDSCEKTSGYSRAELLKPKHFIDLLPAEEKEKVSNHFKKCVEGKPQNFKTSFYHKQGFLIHVDTAIVPVMINGKVTGVFGVSQDITKQLETEKKIEYMAFHDYLTGLPNRNMLVSHLSELTAASQASQRFALLVIDLDRFKAINDTLGHDTGDSLLKAVAERLKSCLYEKDIVFRQGGDEFIIVLSEADRQTASKVAKRILANLLIPFSINHSDFFTSPSIGISVFPEDGKTADALIKCADLAMYQVKKSGKNNFKFYSSQRHKPKADPLKMEMELHGAIERGELTICYQPKINLKTGKITGAEALLRWVHPERGLVPPETFIPIAEETGLVIPMGDWVLSAACKQAKQWHNKGLFMVVSVNVSSKQFAQSNLPERIQTILRETKLDPNYLEIEITESMTADIKRTITTLQELKKLGLRISIDDFGTGFSSLNYLKQFPVDILKIDQSFVQNLHNSPNDKTIVKTIISMAHNLNLSVVAEGIETQEQLSFLQQYLCDEGQGYFLSKPLTPQQLEANHAEIQKIVGKFGLAQDINQRNWAQELLRQAKRELDETIQLQQGMTFKFKQIDGRFIHTLCDGELLYKIGLLPAQIVGKELKNFLPASQVKENMRFYKRAWNGEENVTYENEANGIFYLAALRPVKRGGEVVEVIGSCVDITERKQMERKLQESQEKYRLIADNMTDLIGIVDINGTLLYASPSHNTVLGYLPSYFEGKRVIEMIHSDDRLLVSTAFQQIIKTKSPVKIEVRNAHKNGELKLIETFLSPVIGTDGHVEHIILVGRDITEKRRAEEQLWKAEKLQVVGELAAGVAHEIRNPITTIKGFIQLFQKGQMQEEYFDVILPEFSRIEEIIKEFLSLAKTQEIQTSYSSIPTLLKEVETLLESEANLMDTQFEEEIEENVPMILCDPNQMKQVFINIIKNSIESIHSDGVIKIKVFSRKESLVIKISDNGAGMSEERLRKLGEPFYSNKEKGTGLGLMTCFRIIKQHNGTIKITSEENRGTTVEIKLPGLLIEK